MVNLNKSTKLKNIAVKNSLVIPPMVAFGLSNGDGFATNENIEHYDNISKDGAGIVIVEATCINPDGRLAVMQLGIWDDKYIKGLSKISEVIHNNGALAILQLHHAGIKAGKGVIDTPLSSSEYSINDMTSKEMSIEEIVATVKEFGEAALRAERANFDGIEIHGAHGYLLTQFFSRKINKRTDKYGGSFENNLKIADEIYGAVRKNTKEGFIIGIRMGCNDDSLEESIKRAKRFEEIGYDYLHVSTGFDNTPLEIDIPEEFPCNWIVYGGTKIKEKVSIPVIGVNMIKTREQIDYLLENDLLDFVAIGRAQLADPYFINHMLNNEDIITCLECKPCKCFSNRKDCPRYPKK
ncbi:MAG: NADH:flavin oxidoreductase [Gudongella sp.]|nr:NADH:flavin oxidoreductase [Gudongella sp.]